MKVEKIVQKAIAAELAKMDISIKHRVYLTSVLTRAVVVALEENDK